MLRGRAFVKLCSLLVPHTPDALASWEHGPNLE